MSKSKTNSLTTEQEATIKQTEAELRTVRRVVRELAGLPRARQLFAFSMLEELQIPAKE